MLDQRVISESGVISGPCLSIRQPWAELILRGEKTIENRSWRTNHRGTLYIHAGLKTDVSACRRFQIDPRTVRTGAVIGSVQLVNVTTKSRSRWAEPDC